MLRMFRSLFFFLIFGTLCIFRSSSALSFSRSSSFFFWRFSSARRCRSAKSGTLDAFLKDGAFLEMSFGWNVALESSASLRLMCRSFPSLSSTSLNEGLFLAVGRNEEFANLSD